MDIVLKENDVKRMLGEALGVEIAPEDMIVDKEPFTVTISNAEMYLGKKPRKPVLQRNDPETEDSDEDRSPSDDDSPLLSIDELHRQSAGMADMPPATGSAAKQAFKRPLRSNETEGTPPPTERGREKL